VFWPAVTLFKVARISEITTRLAKKDQLKDVNANQWLVTRRLGSALGLLWTEAELAIGGVLTPRDGHYPPVFVILRRQRKMRDSAAACMFYFTPHDILHKSESRIWLTSRAFVWVVSSSTLAGNGNVGAGAAATGLDCTYHRPYFSTEKGRKATLVAYQP
jgi:hypothetical protein